MTKHVPDLGIVPWPATPCPLAGRLPTEVFFFWVTGTIIDLAILAVAVVRHCPAITRHSSRTLNGLGFTRLGPFLLDLLVALKSG
jgi:hypothetical protein